MQEKNLSQVLREQMTARGQRFWAGDNISDYMSDAIKEKLIDEATVAFEGVLDALLIDRENDPNSKGTARRLESNMYRAGQMQCVSFGHDKPLAIGRGGAILLDDETAYQALLRMRYDGRDLTVSPWVAQQEFRVGYHYRPTIEEAERGLQLLSQYQGQPPREVVYPDCRQIRIVE